MRILILATTATFGALSFSPPSPSLLLRSALVNLCRGLVGLGLRGLLIVRHVAGVGFNASGTQCGSDEDQHQ